MQRSDSLTKIAPALVKALAKIEGVAKTKANPGFKGSKYATLEAVIDASKEHLTECGLTILQLPGPLVGGVLTLETMILHDSGEFISGEFGIALGKQDPQGVGSAISYARRYALMAALNMPAVDDDGEAAQGRQWPSQAPANALLAEVSGLKRLSSAQAKAKGLDKDIAEQIWGCTTTEELFAWRKDFDKHTAECPLSWLDSISNDIILRAEAIATEDLNATMDNEFKAVVS